MYLSNFALALECSHQPEFQFKTLCGFFIPTRHISFAMEIVVGIIAFIRLCENFIKTTKGKVKNTDRANA